MSESAESCAWIPSPSATRRSSVTRSGSRGRWKTKVWQRERTVGEHLLQLGRAEDEHEVGRRLLDELEKRLPRGVRELVRLVEDVDLVSGPRPAGGRRARGSRGRRRSRAATRRPSRRRRASSRSRSRGRRGTSCPGVGDGPGVPGAVQRLREDARHRRLARSARPGEEVGLAHLVVLDRVLQRPDDRLLPDDLVEALRAVLPVERRHPVDSSRWVNARPRAPSSRSVSPEVSASPARIGRSRGT